MTTINLSHVCVIRVDISSEHGLVIHLGGERGTPNRDIRERQKIVIYTLCGIDVLVREVMLAHDREVRRVEKNRDWQETTIRRHLLNKEDVVPS